MIRIGVDEAGRGPVIGPLVVAGVSMDEKDLEKFKGAGIKDSKLLSIRRIYQLESFVMENAYDFKHYEIWPADIDGRSKENTNLNYLELDKMAKIANELKGDIVTVDSPSANTSKVEKYLTKLIKDKKVVARNYADRDFIEVSAASIIAKANREREIEKIKKDIGYDFSSGYPSDPRTANFLSIIIENGKISEMPYKKYIRSTWRTISRLKDRTLSDY